MKHFRQKTISAAAFTALLLLSLACGLPPARSPRPFPIPPVADDDYGSPLSHPDRQFPLQAAAVNAVAFDPTGKWMATAGEDKVVTIWDFQETRIAFELRGHATGVTSIAFSPDGKALASAAHDGSLRIWDVRTGQLRMTLTLGKGDIRSIAYSPDASLLATASSDRSVRLWDTNSGSLVKKLTGHSAAVNTVAFSPDGNTLATASSDKTVRLWDVRTGGLFQTLSGHTEPVLAVQFSPDDRIVASSGARLALSHHGELKFWSAQTGREVLSPPFHSPTSALTFRPDGKALALACYGSDRLWNILILDLRDGRPLRHYVAHSRRITQLAYSPDGLWLASVSFDKSIRAWH